MDFADRLHQLIAQIPNQLEHIETEQATKNALILPFINALGYNVFDPTEVIPEFTADVGIKKGEKVDYAIKKDGSLIILVECKCVGGDLKIENASQLYRYFTVTDARFAILTNGVEYHFYTDLDEPNRMDKKPFLVINLVTYDERLTDELKKFTKPAFDVDDILSTANDLKYRREILHLIAAEFKSPSASFVRHFASQVYSGPMRQSVIEEFTNITRQALQQYITDQVNVRLQTAARLQTNLDQISNDSETADDDEEAERQTIFTEEEHEGYLIVKAILREVVDPNRIAHRDTLSYCGILLDDNNRKPICRLRFNRSQKYIGLIDEAKNEERLPINDLNEIYQYAERLKATVAVYEGIPS